jgi:hypothetical protein
VELLKQDRLDQSFLKVFAAKLISRGLYLFPKRMQAEQSVMISFLQLAIFLQLEFDAAIVPTPKNQPERTLCRMGAY